MGSVATTMFLPGTEVGLHATRPMGARLNPEATAVVPDSGLVVFERDGVGQSVYLCGEGPEGRRVVQCPVKPGDAVNTTEVLARKARPPESQMDVVHGPRSTTNARGRRNPAGKAKG